MNGEFDTVFRNGHTPPGLVILGDGRAIQTSSPAYEERSLQYQAQCSIGATGTPTSIALTVRSRTDYAVWLMLRTHTGSIFLLAYDSFPTPGKIDYRDFEVNIDRSAPLDGQWHKITLQPSKDLSHLGGPAASGVAGVWIAGQVDVASITIHGQQKQHKAYSINAGPDCGWSEACPRSAPAFCSTAGSTGVIDGSVTSGTDHKYGEYSRFVPLPPVAYTTIYQAPSRAWVFDAATTVGAAGCPVRPTIRMRGRFSTG